MCAYVYVCECVFGLSLARSHDLMNEFDSLCASKPFGKNIFPYATAVFESFVATATSHPTALNNERFDCESALMSKEH